MNPDLEWQRRYEEEDTPWDKGAAAPALIAFLREKPIAGRVLVPGCGRGHEVRALGTMPGTTAIGLDLAATAIAQARQLTPPSIGARVEFVEGDFLNLPVTLKESFDWLVEHTCFCALDPSQRTDYVRAAATALKPGSKIFGIFYLNPDTDSGPPFAITREDLSALFDPHFILLEEWVPNETFPGRENRELVRILQNKDLRG